MSESRSRPSAAVRIAVPDVSRHAHLPPGNLKPALGEVFRIGEQSIPAPPPLRTPTAAREAGDAKSKKETATPAEVLTAEVHNPPTGDESSRARSLRRWIPGRRQTILLTLAALLMGMPALLAYWPSSLPTEGQPQQKQTPAGDSAKESPTGAAPKDAPSQNTTPEKEGPFLHDAAESNRDGSLVERPAPPQGAGIPGVAQLEGVILKPTLKASHDDPAIQLR